MIPANLFSAAVLLLLVSGSSEAPTRDPASYADDKIYVHLVPHTHDDVGWLKTVDQYYYGGNKTITPNAVKYILDTVIDELQKDEKRTFIYVEIAFFERWWRQQTDDMKTIVKKLVAKKQLEFINGGWCMNDEASTHYNAIIDQMTLGLQFIESTFGPEARPRIAWQIDPFGHSNEQAALFASMGFDGLFFSRHDYDDHNQRINEKKLQMVWQPSESLGESADLFTGIMTRGYGPPKGFCFDIKTKCTDDLIQDDPDLYDYNVDRIVDNFIAAIYAEYNISVVNHIMFNFGSDFQFIDARINYDNIDKLIKYTNMKNSSVEVFYSTPSAYVDALHAANKTWTVKKDDFFPYANDPYSFWTGYFTSRPALKGYVREMNNLLQVCTQIEAMGFGTMKKLSDNTTRYLIEAMGVAQHHDAVSDPPTDQSSLLDSNLVDSMTLQTTLTDFGLSRAISSTTIIGTKTMMAGSPGFQAPEQLRAESLGPHCDVYAFGCVVIVVYREEALWPGLSPYQILCKVSVNNVSPCMEGLCSSVKNICISALKPVGERPPIQSVLKSLLEIVKTA